jgi:hypothetical protein
MRDQILPDGHGVAPAGETKFDQFAEGFGSSGRRASRRRRRSLWLGLGPWVRTGTDSVAPWVASIWLFMLATGVAHTNRPIYAPAAMQI